MKEAGNFFVSAGVYASAECHEVAIRQSRVAKRIANFRFD
jgi:hypothetical protein